MAGRYSQQDAKRDGGSPQDSDSGTSSRTRAQRASTRSKKKPSSRSSSQTKPVKKANPASRHTSKKAVKEETSRSSTQQTSTRASRKRGSATKTQKKQSQPKPKPKSKASVQEEKKQSTRPKPPSGRQAAKAQAAKTRKSSSASRQTKTRATQTHTHTASSGQTKSEQAKARRTEEAPQEKRPTAPVIRPSQRLDAMWNWSDLLLISITLIIAFFVSSNVMRSTLAELLPGTGQATLRLILLLVFYVIEILVVVYIAHRHNYRFSILYRLRPASEDAAPGLGKRVGEIGMSSLLIFGFLVLTRGFGMLWSFATDAIGWHPTSTGDVLTMFGTSQQSIVLAVICVVVLAPFIEEIIFRGVFLPTLDMMMPLWVAVAVTAMIFAVYHASLWAFIPHVVLGLATGYLAVECRTLWPAIILHALYNATLVAAPFFLAF